MEKWTQDDEFINYDISNKGRVKNRKTKKLLSTSIDKQGDEVVYMYDGKKKVKRKISRLVAKHYLDGDINESYVKHKNYDKTKNYADNLYLVNKHNGKKIKIVETGEVFGSLTDCSKSSGISKSYLSRCINYPFYKNKKKYHFKIMD